MGGGGGSTNQTTTANPWAGQIPYLQGSAEGGGYAPLTGGGAATSTGILGQMPAASALYADTKAWPGFYQGFSGITTPQSPTYVQNNDVQNAAISGLEGFGLSGGSQALQGANSAISNLMGGQNGANNPGGIQQANADNNETLTGSYLQPAQASFNKGNTLSGALAGGQFLGATGGTFDTSNGYLNGMLRGDTLNPFNAPGFQNVINGTLANVIPATSASFINGGRSDSGLAQAATTAAATNAIGSLANQNYLQEQGLQQQAAGLASQNESTGLTNAFQNQQLNSQNMMGQQGLMQNAASQLFNNFYTNQGDQLKGAALAPGIDSQTLTNLQAAYQAGTLSQQDLQSLVNSNIDQWNYNQTLPESMLGMYHNMTGTQSYGGTTSLNTPYHSNTAASALGGAASGAALGTMIMPGWGTAGGAVIGGLMGLFS